MAWEGFPNARDLGGLPLRHGGSTRFGAFYRAATVDFVTARGWDQAYDAGVRTVIDLRNDDEVGAETCTPTGIVRRREPLDGIDDADYWGPLLASGLHGTPLYYEGFLRRKSDRVAAVMTLLARSEGGVICHCGGGRDRTGLITLLLLGVAGVDVQAIVDDYMLVDDSLATLRARLGRPDEQPEIDALLAAHGTDARQVISHLLTTVDPVDYLRSAGVLDADIHRLRDQLAPPHAAGTSQARRP